MIARPGQLVMRGCRSALWVVVLATAASAQAPDAGEDARRYVRGLVDLDVPEVLDRYLDQVARENPLEASLLRIEAETARRQRVESSPEERRAALERTLEIRRDLIDAYPDDRRHVVWRIDQASDLFFDQLAIDATGLTAMCGNPSPEQAARAASAAREIHVMASAAEVDIHNVILAIEDELRFTDDVALQLRRRRLVENERDARVPFFRGVGAFLQATLNETDATTATSLLEVAVARLLPLADHLEGDLGAKTRLS